jgi:hypothetical protein
MNWKAWRLGLFVTLGALFVTCVAVGCSGEGTVDPPPPEPENVMVYDSVVATFSDIADGVEPDTVEFYGEWLNYDANAMELDPFYYTLEIRDNSNPTWTLVYQDYYFEPLITFGGQYSPGVWFEVRWTVYTVTRSRNDTTYVGGNAVLVWSPPEL